MRWLFSFLLFTILGAVRALSSSGSRLLVVLEDENERDKYGVFLEDLASKCRTLVTENQTCISVLNRSKMPGRREMSYKIRSRLWMFGPVK